MNDWDGNNLHSFNGWNFYHPANFANGQPVFPSQRPVQPHRPTDGGIAHRVRERKLMKRGLPNQQSVRLNAFTGIPELPIGMHEVSRQKEYNPVGSHFGVLFVNYGGTWAYDLQFKGGPRIGISFQKFAAGKVVYVTRSIPLGPEMYQALDRLRY